MTPSLDQLADEAIERRHTWAGESLAVRKARRGGLDPAVAEVVATLTWSAACPALAALADARIAALKRLGVTPDAETTATAGGVHLATIQDQPPVEHRYTVIRDLELEQAIGVAWLSTDPDLAPGTYVVHLHDHRGGVYGRSLAEALQRMATLLADTERADRKAGAR